ncbi:hypothetical protein [Paraburkholderia dinghuensis]|uniref:Uncharacterized protein n=1 Tax=Paraburkholderia dinghuensis TaxID=2305225 RepID=A0A3N6N251_9BURK|nr:hypothetical protein [Paraburkholderia dinghuensis]RQH01677.1 hypothetical protein D1Y85_23210 [Paraburkholderia dinghuensis]
MRKIALCILIASTCQFAHAEQPPAVGLWEQLAAGDTGGSPANTQRVDVVFVDRKINEDVLFSGLFDIGEKVEVLCCVNVIKSALITLPELLKKYPWDPDTAEHLTKITGWKYIYEARVVDSSEQNARMRSLIKSLIIPPALSPYSAPVVVGKIPAVEIDKKFKVGSADVAYSMRVSQDKRVISYKFLINGKPVTLTEENFPD